MQGVADSTFKSRNPHLYDSTREVHQHMYKLPDHMDLYPEAKRLLLQNLHMFLESSQSTT